MNLRGLVIVAGAAAVATLGIAPLASAGPVARLLVSAPTLPRAVAVPPAKRRLIGILDVRVDGVEPEVAATFQANLEAQLDTGQYAMASRKRVKQMMERSTKWTDGCLVGGCLREVMAQTGAELVLIASLTGSGTSYGYVVTLLRTDTGEVVSQDSDRCDVCTATEAVDAATIATIKLVTSAPDTLPDAAADRAVAMATAEAPFQARVAELSHHRKHVGWTLAITGLATAAVGGAIYAVAHDREAGAAVLAGGGGLAASGVIVLAF